MLTSLKRHNVQKVEKHNIQIQIEHYGKQMKQ